MPDRTITMMEYEDWRPKQPRCVDYFVGVVKPWEKERISYENLARLLGNVGMAASAGMKNDPIPHQLGCGCPICTPSSFTSTPSPRSFWYEFLGRLMP